MKKIMRCLALCGVLFATSCADENLTPNVEETGNVAVKVSVGMESRTMIDDNGFNIWNEQGSEAIFVISEDGDVYGTLNLVRGSLKEEGKNATFSGTVIGDPAQLKYAYYPAPEMVNGEWRIKMGQVIGKDHKAPMYGNITHAQDGSWSVNFNNAGALVRFQIDGVAGEDLGFTATMGDKNVTGGYYTLNGSGLKFNPAEEGGRTDVLGFPEDGIVYLPVGLVEGQSNVKIEAVLHQDGGPINLFTLTDIPVQQNYISTYSVPNYVVSAEGDAEASVEINDIDDLKNAFSNGGNYKLSADFNDKTNVVTSTLTLESGKTLTLDLNKKEITCTEGNSHVIINKGELVLKNGTISDNRNVPEVATLFNLGKAVLNCKLYSLNSNAINGGVNSHLIVNGGHYEAKNNEEGQGLRLMSFNENGKAVDSAWRLEINGGTFKGKHAGIYLANNYDGLKEEEGSAVIRNATLTSEDHECTSTSGKKVHSADLMVSAARNITIENCTLSRKDVRNGSGSPDRWDAIVNGVNMNDNENHYECVMAKTHKCGE